VDGRKGKGVEFDVSIGQYDVRHRCAFEAICALVGELSDAQRESIRGTVWEPVLEYTKFVMDRHMVEALIYTWNPDALAFIIGEREVQFS